MTDKKPQSIFQTFEDAAQYYGIPSHAHHKLIQEAERSESIKRALVDAAYNSKQSRLGDLGFSAVTIAGIYLLFRDTHFAGCHLFLIIISFALPLMWLFIRRTTTA